MAGTNGKQTVNTFLKGMDLDTDVTLVSKDSYIYAENVRIIVDNSSNTGSLHAVEGLKLLNTNVIQYKYYEKNVLNNTIIEKYSNFTSSKFNIIAVFFNTACPQFRPLDMNVLSVLSFFKFSISIQLLIFLLYNQSNLIVSLKTL